MSIIVCFSCIIVPYSIAEAAVDPNSAAIIAVRENMLKRNKVFSVELKSKDSDYKKEVSECTRKYDRESTTLDNEDNNYSSNIETQELNSSIYEGKTSSIQISALPKGYKKSDLNFISNDNSVVTVDSNGTITGKKSGSTTITISTSDGKYSVEYAVFVLEKLAFFEEDCLVYDEVLSI